MKQYSNMWFDSSELVRAAKAISKKIKELPINWLKGGNSVKYIQLRIDQRTGDFIVMDNYGRALSNAELYDLFPELAGD